MKMMTKFKHIHMNPLHSSGLLWTNTNRNEKPKEHIKEQKKSGRNYWTRNQHFTTYIFK